MLLFALAITGCSDDDKSTVYNDTAGTNDVNLKAACSNVGPFSNLSVYSVSQGTPVDIYWTTPFANTSGRYFISYFDYIPLTGCVNTGRIRVESEQIPYFNDNWYSIPSINAPCFQWRIRYVAYSTTTNQMLCSDASPFQTFQY